MATPAEQFECTGCGDEFPLTEKFFHRDGSSLTGFKHKCKKCRQEAKAAKVEEKMTKLMEDIHADGVTLLEQFRGAGGTVTPHITELYQYLMGAFGGAERLSRLFAAEYYNSAPGSQIRTKLLNAVVGLGVKCSEQGHLDRDLANMSTLDLEAAYDRRLKKLHPENHEPETQELVSAD